MVGRQGRLGKSPRTGAGRQGADGDWVHAYLHRKEGDLGNAGYWYRRARKPASSASLAEEWAAIAAALLGGES